MVQRLIAKLLLAFAAAGLIPTAAAMANGVSLAQSVFVERAQPAGKSVREPLKAMTPGSTLLFVVSYNNRGDEPAEDVVVTNPVPAGVAFAGCDGHAIVSVDGGRSWGVLDTLSVKAADGSMRPARPADVTHVRWSFPRAIGAGETGELSFRAVVR